MENVKNFSLILRLPLKQYVGNFNSAKLSASRARLGKRQCNRACFAKGRKREIRHQTSRDERVARTSCHAEFYEKNISNSDEMLVMLEEVVTTAGLRKQKRWSVSLPSNTARTAILTLENEPTSKDELSEILDWKAENTFGVPSGEMRISRRKITPDASGKARYFATAVKLSVIDEYETLFEMTRLASRFDFAARRQRSKLAD